MDLMLGTCEAWMLNCYYIECSGAKLLLHSIPRLLRFAWWRHALLLDSIEFLSVFSHDGDSLQFLRLSDGGLSGAHRAVAF